MRLAFEPAIDTSDKQWVLPEVESVLDHLVLREGLYLHIKSEDKIMISSELYQGDHVYDTKKGVVVLNKRTIAEESRNNVRDSLFSLLSKIPKENSIKNLFLVNPEAFENNWALTEFLKQFEKANFRAIRGNAAFYLDGRKRDYFPKGKTLNMWWFGLDALYEVHFGHKGYMGPNSRDAFSRIGRELNFSYGSLFV